jgi:hypothetical protein
MLDQGTDFYDLANGVHSMILTWIQARLGKLGFAKSLTQFHDRVSLLSNKKGNLHFLK